MTAYCAAKHGVIGLTKSAALDHARDGIRINAVCPGAIATPMLEENYNEFPELEEEHLSYQPMGRIGQAHEVGDAVLWLCSASSSLMNGAAVAVDGGLSAQ
jgi:NAD(P)-dependent dehydrogenase (short-subunit alcohol dehydrogenase family)